MSESYTKVSRSAINLKIVVFIRFCMANELNGQGLPVHHTQPYKNWNFQKDCASRYFGVWLWQLVHLLILVCSFQCCVLFLCLAKLYRSCPIRDEGLFWELTTALTSNPILVSVATKHVDSNSNQHNRWAFVVAMSMEWMRIEIILGSPEASFPFLALHLHRRQVFDKFFCIIWVTFQDLWIVQNAVICRGNKNIN